MNPSVTPSSAMDLFLFRPLTVAMLIEGGNLSASEAEWCLPLLPCDSVIALSHYSTQELHNLIPVTRFHRTLRQRLMIALLRIRGEFPLPMQDLMEPRGVSAPAAMEMDSSHQQPSSSPPLRPSVASAAATLLFPSSLPRVAGDELSPLALGPPSSLSSSSSGFGLSSSRPSYDPPIMPLRSEPAVPSTPNSAPPMIQKHWHPANVIELSDEKGEEKKVVE